MKPPAFSYTDYLALEAEYDLLKAHSEAILENYSNLSSENIERTKALVKLEGEVAVTQEIVKQKDKEIEQLRLDIKHLEKDLKAQGISFKTKYEGNRAIGSEWIGRG